MSQKEQVGRHVDVSECFKQDLNLRANCAISGVLGADVREVRTCTLADLDEGHVWTATDVGDGLRHHADVHEVSVVLETLFFVAELLTKQYELEDQY